MSRCGFLYFLLKGKQREASTLRARIAVGLDEGANRVTVGGRTELTRASNRKLSRPHQLFRPPSAHLHGAASGGPADHTSAKPMQRLRDQDERHYEFVAFVRFDNRKSVF